MSKETTAAHSAAELLSAGRHAADFTSSRMDYIATRLRPLALILATLLPIWIPIDYLLLPSAAFLPLAGLRLVMGGLALVLYFLSSKSTSLTGTLGRLTVLVAIPTILYIAARLQLDPGGSDLLYGYAFFPVLTAAMLSVFPLTLLEGLVFGLPVLLGYGALEMLLGATLDSHWLGMLWLLSLIVLIALSTQLSQLRMLLDLFRRATRDTATGALNRRSLTERLEAEHSRWQRHDRPLAVLLVSLAGLERVTQEHGVATTNDLLAQLASILGRALRPTDLIGRWNTATLLAVLPETGQDTAQHLAARVREVAEFASVTLPTGAIIRGEPRVVVTAPASQERLEELLARIDRQLPAAA